MTDQGSAIPAARNGARPRLLQVEGMHNVRDVGGYPVFGGGTTRWGVLFRGGTLGGLPEGTRAQLGAIGVRTVVDLREAVEFDAVQVPEMAGAPAKRDNPIFRDRKFAALSSELEPLYLQILELCAAEIVSAIGLLATPGALPAIVHCSAGKDRTGLVIGLTLSAVGVPDEVVTQDYGRTEEHLTDELRQHIAAKGAKLGIDAQRIALLMGSPPRVLQSVLDVIRHEFGGAEGYLLTHGLPQSALDCLREQLVDPA